MKYSLLLISALITLNVFSQKTFSQKLWVGNHNEYLLADSNVIRFETFSSCFGKTIIAREYSLFGDTLRLSDNNIPKKPFNSDFLIDVSCNDEMILEPIDANAALLANSITGAKGETQLKFKEIDRCYTDSIKFEKIIFNSTTCYGFCPSMTLEIDNRKQVRFIGKEFAIKQGFFYSTISDSLFYQLNEILKVTELDKIEYTNSHWPDAPTYTLEVHYNGKIRFFRSERPAFVTHELIKYLQTIPAKLNLRETRDKFDITFVDE